MTNEELTEMENQIDKWNDEVNTNRLQTIQVCRNVMEILKEMDDIHAGTMEVFQRVEQFLEEQKPCGK